MDEDKIIAKLIEHDELFKEIKEEVTGLKNNMGQVLHSLDGMTHQTGLGDCLNKLPFPVFLHRHL